MKLGSNFTDLPQTLDVNEVFVAPLGAVVVLAPLGVSKLAKCLHIVQCQMVRLWYE